MIIRAMTSALGTIAICWALNALQSFQASEPINILSRQISAGEAFPDEILVRASESRDLMKTFRVTNAATIRSAAILNLRLVELALDHIDQVALDARLERLRGVLHDALVANPADPFLWLTRYWLGTTEGIFASDNLRSLASSYDLGPREGWIASRRDRLGLAVFLQLDEATQQRVVDEFCSMVGASFTSEVADNLTGPGWPIRNRLVGSLNDVDVAARRALAKALSSRGIALEIPGVLKLEDRPWR